VVVLESGWCTKVLNFGKAVVFGGAILLLLIKCPKDHMMHTNHHAPCPWKSLIVVHKEPQIPFKAPNKPYYPCFCLEGALWLFIRCPQTP
jgi:hypothetical protein